MRDVLSPCQYIDAVKTWMLLRNWAFARRSWLETETWFVDGGHIVMGGQSLEASMLLTFGSRSGLWSGHQFSQY